MEDIINILQKAWLSIKPYETGSLQLGIAHPLDWFVAYETPTNKALIILSHLPIDTLEPSKCISTACRRRDDGSYYISCQLIENTQEDVFISMCSNIIEYSANALSEKDALKRVAARYRQWRRLMEYRNLAVLSDEKRRGLIGELLYLKQVIENGKSLSEALDGWVGPSGADQDFVYEGLWREIKTTGLASDQITIHSVEQLGRRSETGELQIYRIDPCAPETKDAFTLKTIIRTVMDLFRGDEKLVETFTDKLNMVGYIDLEIYDKYYYKFFRNDAYEVNETFPRITRENVSAEIIRCDYVISVSSIERWKRG